MSTQRPDMVERLAASSTDFGAIDREMDEQGYARIGVSYLDGGFVLKYRDAIEIRPAKDLFDEIRARERAAAEAVRAGADPFEDLPETDRDRAAAARQPFDERRSR